MLNTIKPWFNFEIVALKKLNGYDNVNYLLKTETDNYIFKTYLFSEDMLALIEAENSVLQTLKKDQSFPEPIPFATGDFLKITTIDGVKTICRLLTFLEGTFLGDATHTPELLESIGRFTAQMDLQLLEINNYVLKARAWEWDLQYLHLNKKYIHDIEVASDRHLVSYFFQQYELHVTPILPDLRKSVIHNDVNEWNVLVTNHTVSGLIDFGDVTYSPLINELAIAITYACFDKTKPLEWAIHVIKGYHEVLPLEAKELEILYYLIAGRLCTSVCNSAHAKKTDPDNVYASVSEKNAWNILFRWLTINPIHAKSEFLKAAHFRSETPKPINDHIAKRHKVSSPILSLSYDEPIYMVGAAFQYMYDGYGNTFLDAYNNIPHIGHAHPEITKIASQQIATLNTNTRYIFDAYYDYAEALLSKFPEALDTVFFVNSGSAASDLAMRLAHAHTKHDTIMVMEHGYHGNTQTSIDISHYKYNNKKGQGQKHHIIETAIPDTYRGQYTTNDGSAGKAYAQDAIQQVENSDTPIAAFITEPVVGCGGQVPLAKDYLKHVYPAIRQQGGICISDEVQTGFGRLGDHFWGFEAQEVVPDVVILGKPIANGHPMGAVVTTKAIAESFSKGVEFFSSFGGNPVSCKIALTVLKEIESSQLQQNAKVVGDYYQSLFNTLKERYNCIGDVRGSGLFIGVEIVQDNSIEPNTELAHHIKNELRNRYILISTDGPHDSVIKTKPPLCFTKANAKLVVDTMASVLEGYYENRV
ncbi:aminotransferase class III-fold pyridoxal phosphate-dependent enzyme [Psychroserpens burtonensis]|uniref:Aminotransferase class III-fold pyridoxal phosphate-dependent enzyme n=1 Tax=Psychroserpens burtonensis TaxID=49278 RepID=A0A5C7BFB0_9FLAO|nr:aminotransferase class III-fold pyridoxal phosphate-dependent enzyme [Psychroserpens burtonensis]TXE18075.1 aminotransferase class III-fold pyridoxal phosphate-dependent enzyme [Psychroserpens burtonensis]